jgi:hypothetical protein
MTTMHRRDFLQGIAATAAGWDSLSRSLGESAATILHAPQKAAQKGAVAVSFDGYTQVASFKTEADSWIVCEDLRTREGSLVFVASSGERRMLAKTAEASMPEGIPYLGLALKEIGVSSPDLLADRLLQNGDPDPDRVKSAAPPMASADKNPRTWTTFVGTREAYDVTPVYRSGNTRTYHPIQYSPELREALKKGQVYDGLVGGWMPAVRKVIPASDHAYWEVIVFGDVGLNKNKYIVHTWHRTALIEGGKIAKVVFGHSYPAYLPGRVDPQPEEFYRALLAFAEYWDQQLHDFTSASLPQSAWIDMSKHSFAKELMTRPGGVYPKYGAVDRDYAGSEYDGFQDVFTSAIYTNMEWGRFETARLFIDNYFTEYVDSKGMIDMRGPETAQFGMTLSLLARYFNYTHDRALIVKHRGKIEATAKLLGDMHDDSLQLPRENPAYGLIRGWSESDSCLTENPSLYWQPYYANSAFAARGFTDIARAWMELARINSSPSMEKQAQGWRARGQTLRERTVESINKNIQTDVQTNNAPPYIGLFPGTTLTFRESLEREKPSPQQWPHRPYAELLQADVLPPHLASQVVDCMRAHGATTLGVVANVWRFQDDGREILGFISYGYAQALLRLDRIEEFLLFLYSHRYHAHTRGSWTAGEVTGITGDSATYCVPAQQTVPLLVRWMLVLEDSDEDRVYLAKGVPREWVASGQDIGIEHAPTRWGSISFNLVAKPSAKSVVGHVELSGANAPKEVHFKLRLPLETPVRTVTVNGQAATLGGLRNDTVVIITGNEKRFEVVGRIG